MDKRTCIIDDCTRPQHSRQVCALHYGRAYRAGRLDELPPSKGEDPARHRLTEVDRENRTAVCSLCGTVAIRLRNGRRGPECMVKRNADRKRYRVGPQSYSPDDHRRWKYGLTQQELDALVAEADGCCLICGVDTKGEYHVDHCHATGVVRGILCRRCNYGLGWFNDDPARMLAAHLYLIARGKPA